MKVTMKQLATWIERDGWTAARYHDDGSRTYRDGSAEVYVPAFLIAELDELRAGYRIAAMRKAASR